MGIDRKFLLCGLFFAIAGLCLGIYMAISRNHAEMPAHAHIMLVGFVFSFIYATIHRLWLPGLVGKLKSIQFILHELGALLLAVGLLLLFSGHGSEDSLGPCLGIGAFSVLLAMLMMTWMVMRARPAS
ncbi:MAG: TonB-dependent receptor [Xanthomonadales bacterium]|nr:TonB-dependent receptor [Xanthomonadales bacterium]